MTNPDFKRLYNYIPFDLTFKQENTGFIWTATCVHKDGLICLRYKDELECIGDEGILEFKPLLVPFDTKSNIWKEISEKYQGEGLLQYGVSKYGLRLSILYEGGSIGVEHIVWEEFFGYHVDVFGLIKKGIALEKY